jgi:hypothetical protein
MQITSMLLCAVFNILQTDDQDCELSVTFLTVIGEGHTTIPSSSNGLENSYKAFSFLLDTFHSFGEKISKTEFVSAWRCKEGARGGAVG